MTQITEYIDVMGKIRELDCNIPTTLAFLPRNFDTAKTKGELVHERNKQTIKILFREKGIVP